MSIAAAMLGGTVASGLFSSRSASKAADAQADAAEKAADAQLQATRETNALNRDIYNTSLSMYQPSWESGISNQAARDYALGTGARPDTLTFNYPGAIGGGFGGASSEIETVNGSATGGGNAFYMSEAQRLKDNAKLRGDKATDQRLTGNEIRYLEGLRNDSGGGSSTYYKVGDKTFGTMDEAQQYAQGLGGANTGGEFTPTYNGYAPMQEYFSNLKNLDNFEASPDYQFRRSEGIDSMKAAAAAGGLRLSGNTLRGIGEFSSNLADSEYTDYYNRGAGEYYNWLNGLGGAAATLPNTTGAISGAGSNYAANVGNALANSANARSNAYMNAGAAKASGYEGQASAFNNSIGNMSQLYMMNSLTDGGLFKGNIFGG